jgi:hypothetical protein
LTYGVVTWMTGGNHRLAILLTGAFFIVALVILVFVNEARGHRTGSGYISPKTGSEYISTKM